MGDTNAVVKTLRNLALHGALTLEERDHCLLAAQCLEGEISEAKVERVAEAINETLYGLGYPCLSKKQELAAARAALEAAKET